MPQTLSTGPTYRWPLVDRRARPAPGTATSPAVVDALDLLMDQDGCGPREAMTSLRAQASLLDLPLDRAAQLLVALAVGPTATAALRARWIADRAAGAQSSLSSASDAVLRT